MSEINPQRLVNELRHLRTIANCGSGVVRPAFSTKDMEARQWLLDRMAAAGLKASMDGVGNVFGRSPNPGRGVLIGSHTDTQPQGGSYLAGWLAGKMTRSNIVGIVASGEPPTWNRMSAGFAQGLKASNPNSRLLYSVIGAEAYSDAAGAKRNTQDQIAVGADVIFGLGDGASFGMLQACSTKKARDGGKIWFIDVIGDKGAIDLQHVNRKLMDAGQRRVATPFWSESFFLPNDRSEGKIPSSL